MKHQQRLLAIAGLMAAGITFHSAGLASLGEEGVAAAKRNPQDGAGGDELVGGQWPDPPAIHGADDATEAAIRAGIRRYADSGLHLPPLRIYVHDSSAGCDGYAGLFNKDGSGHRVDLCNTIVLLHELAHVWEFHNMDDARRQAFMERTGLRVWNDRAAARSEQGVEEVARIVSSGVRGEQLGLDELRLDSYREHLDLYAMLTGLPSPRIADLIEAGWVGLQAGSPAAARPILVTSPATLPPPSRSQPR